MPPRTHQVSSDHQGREATGMFHIRRKVVIGPEVLVITGRMLETLKLLADGKTNKQIAGLMEISIKTVEKHRQRLNDTFGVDNGISLVMEALRAKVISL